MDSKPTIKEQSLLLQRFFIHKLSQQTAVKFMEIGIQALIPFTTFVYPKLSQKTIAHFMELGNKALIPFSSYKNV